MAHEVSTESYATIVAEAEAAVSAVKDPELRRVAFEKILTTLLERQSAASHSARHGKGVRHRSEASAKSGRSAKATRKGPKANLEALIDDGFFKEPRTIAEVKAELANRGYHIVITSLSGPLQALTRQKRLRRQKGKGESGTYAYSNW